MRHKNFALTLAAIAAVLFAGGRASAVVSYGTLCNFDVINDTGQETHGFEIELEGISTSDVAYTFGGTYQRYGDPTLVPTGTGVIIRYAAGYDPVAMQWSAGTPFSGPPYLPTMGHSCWTGGVADPATYYSGGCDHFGASLNRNPTNTIYRWLVETAPGSGTLSPSGSNVSLPAPVWSVVPQPTPTPAGTPPPPPPPVVVAAVVPPPPAEFQFGDAMWAKVYVTEMPEGLQAADLDQMVIDHPVANIVPHEPAEVEMEWVLMQSGPAGSGEQDYGGQAAADSQSVSRRFEFYKYIGEYDPDTHEALCDVQANCPEAVGDIIGAQNAAVNLNAIIIRSVDRLVADFDSSGCTELNDFLFLLDNWELDVDGIAVGLDDFLALLDNWQLGVACP